ncbi:MAG: 4Fe-4S dicluster domain-containing protein [Spirochaetales bacterium]|nr:4Fe-4S dicluster domain-containing protein [Spirochaetales bacterium]
MALLINEQDTKFKYDVAREAGGENITLCFACGLCTASCPVSEIDADYNPRKIIRMVLLGMRQRVLSSDFIWLCTQCYTCQAHCPQKVNFSDVMKALRSMAVREGYVTPAFMERIKEIDSFMQKLRHEMVMTIVDRKNKETDIRPEHIASDVLKKRSL